MAQVTMQEVPLTPVPPSTNTPHTTSSNHSVIENQHGVSFHVVAEGASTTALNGLRPITKQRQALVLVSAFLTVMVTIGFNQSYGVFQSYYTSDGQDMLPRTAKNQPALVAFVGTLGYGLTWAGSIAINPILARVNLKGTRIICILGVSLMSLGFGLASISTQVYQLLLTQGLLYGIGASCLYFPILASAPEYFTSHRGAAMGVVLSGAGLGGLIMAPSIRGLITAVGARWTLRCMALLNLVVSLPIAMTASPSRFIGRRRTHLDLKLALRPSFLLSLAAAFLQAGGNGLPLTFIADYSVAVGYTAGFGATLLAINNGVNSISRIAMGWMGDKVGRQNTLIATVMLCAVFVGGMWMASVGKGGDRILWVIFVVIYGFASGGYNALFPTTIAEVFGISNYASVVGFLYFVRGCGAIFGSPVGGQILGESKIGNYGNVVWYDFALFLGASLSVVGVRIWDARDKKQWLWKA